MKELLYVKIYKDLRDKIIGGAYKYGEKLPSKRTCAINYGVSVITVEHAFELLIGEGYAESREKRGYYCTAPAEDSFLSSVVGETENIYKPSDYKSDFPFGVYSKTVRRVLSTYGEELLKRSENGGTAILRDAVARYLYRSRGTKIDKEQIIIGAGAEYLYGLIVVLLGRERIYAIENPSYEQIEKVYLSNGVKCEKLPLKNGGIETKSLKGSNASVLHITPYRTELLNRATVFKRNEYIKWVNNGDRYIIEDDFESEFSVTGKMPETVFSQSGGKRVIYLNTFSKTVSPAVRVAYMVLDGELMKEFKSKASFYSCTVPVLEQYILAELLNGGDFERHLNRTRRKLKKDSIYEKQNGKIK